MAESKIFTLTEEEAVEQIVETVQHHEPGDAPFALVVGSGFSHGLVPTAREIVEDVLPSWITALQGRDKYEELRARPGAERQALSYEFWKGFAKKNANRHLDLPLASLTGYPIDYSAAYKAAFDPRYRGALGDPAQARKFQRAVMRLDKPRLNAAHFLLASLLGLQPDRTRKNDLYKARAPFCHLLLTTNFDPFLQIALQAASRLYFMSDTPELGLGDELMDAQIDAIHLVYLHGSIHRRLQAFTDADIQALKARNAQRLAEVLKRRGVIVIGYSGWDDAMVEAIGCCEHFDHRLYWCGREPDPLASGAFGPRVSQILRKSTANYVQIRSAGQFMAKIHNQLVQGLLAII